MKKIVLILFVILLLGGISFVYYKNEVMVPILGYHAILPHELNNPSGQFTIDSERFEEQLKTLDKLGYKTLTLDEYYCWQQKNVKSLINLF